MSKTTWLVIPCYNEAVRLDRDAFAAALASPDAPTFLFVDDGSADGTGSVLQQLVEDAGSGRVLRLPKNVGKGEAVRAGLSAALRAGAARVGYWDADLATPLDAVDVFEQVLDERPEIEVVFGARVRLLGRRIERSAARHYIGRAYATAASLALRLPVYDTQCGAKVFRATPALETALGHRFRSRWGFDVELISRLQEAWGHRGVGSILEVPLREWRDIGRSKVSLLGGAKAYLFVLAMLGRRALGRRMPDSAAASPRAGEPVALAGRRR